MLGVCKGLKLSLMVSKYLNLTLIKFKHQFKINNFVVVFSLVLILVIGGYYRNLAIDSNVRIRNGFESTVSMASYLFKYPAAQLNVNFIKPEQSVYDSFPLKDYEKYSTNTDSFIFSRNPDINDSLKQNMNKSRSELGWAFILRYVLKDGMSGSKNMAKRIVRFRFIIELILIALLFFTGKNIAGLFGGILAGLSYAVFLPAVHMMCYITYYYWAIPFSVFSLFFWIVIYEGKFSQKKFKNKMIIFFFYGALMGFATATRMIYLFLPLFLSPFILFKERKIKPTLILLIVMLVGQFILLTPQMFINQKQFGKFSITTRDTWHAVLTGVGIRKNPFGIVNSGDIAVYDYIKRTTGVVYAGGDGMDTYNKACKKQTVKIIKENPVFFINNAIKNIKSAKLINPTGFYAIDTPINRTTPLKEIHEKGWTRVASARFLGKYLMWLVFLALILCFFRSKERFTLFLLLIAQSLYLVLVIGLYFPNYLYYFAGYIPCWTLFVSLSLAIVLKEPFFFLISVYKKRIRKDSLVVSNNSLDKKVVNIRQRHSTRGL